MQSSPPTERDAPEDDLSPHGSSDGARPPVPDIAGLIQQALDGLGDLKRIGLPSDELDRLKDKHPEAYELHIEEMRVQPVHDRKIEVDQLELVSQQMEQANAAQNAQREIASQAMELQSRSFQITESNAKTGRALSWVFAVGLFLLAAAGLVTNAVFVWSGKIDNFNLASSLIGMLVGAGSIVAIIRGLIGRRDVAHPPAIQPDNTQEEGE